ncbi:hypothetical protein LguiB_006970 [Lonicera macranthoides]
MPSLVDKCKTNALPVKCVKEYLMNEMILVNTAPHIIARVFYFFMIGYIFFPNGAYYIHSVCSPLLRTYKILESMIEVLQFLHVYITD